MDRITNETQRCSKNLLFPSFDNRTNQDFYFYACFTKRFTQFLMFSYDGLFQGKLERQNHTGRYGIDAVADSANSIMVTLMRQNGSHYIHITSEIAKGEFNQHTCDGTLDPLYSPLGDNEMAIRLQRQTKSQL